MSFKFRRAQREDVHLLMGFMGPTGSGKTYSAMRFATGLAQGKPFAVLDTEAGRAKHYADDFQFDHEDLQAPFNPLRYQEAILAAEAAGYGVLVVDSMSHEHAGEGGLLDMHEKAWAAKGHQNKFKFQCWVKPKMEHKAMVQRLLQLRMHLILCFRAEPKMKMVGNKPVDDGIQPICAKGLEFEMTASFMLSHERPGLADQPLKLPKPIKSIFGPDQEIGERHGEAVAKWALGGQGKQETPGVDLPKDPQSPSSTAQSRADTIRDKAAGLPQSVFDGIVQSAVKSDGPVDLESLTKKEHAEIWRAVALEVQRREKS